MKKHVHGGDVYHYQNCIDFSANCNPLGTPQAVKDAIIKSASCVGDYPQVGCEPLRRAIGEYEGVPFEQIICGNGAAELIFSLCRAIRPKRALVTGPSFAEYEQALASVDCQVEHFLLREEDEFRVGEDFLNCLQKNPDMVFLCNPNNPTGVLLEDELLLKILETCSRHHILLVVDECFLDFVKDSERHSLKKYLSDCPNLFLLKAFTKRYAMPGVRLGYGFSGNSELLLKMSEMTQPWNVSTIAQMAGIAALQEKNYVEEGRQTVFRESAWMKQQMEDLGIKVFPSQANYIFFKGREDLFDACVEKGILIRDCSNYPGLKKGYYRVAVKVHAANEKLIKALQEIEKERGR